MQNSNLYFTTFQKISEHLTILLNISNTPILTTCQISNLSFYSILTSV